MRALALFLGPSGRLGPRPFVIAAVVVYVAGLASQSLLAAPMVSRAGLWSFALAQAALAWVWFALHAKRLRDAARAIDAAAGIAIVYALAVALLLLILSFFTDAQANDGASRTAPVFRPIGLFALIDLANPRDTELGAFGLMLAIFSIVAVAPVLLAIGFSAWAATRPSVRSQSSPAPPTAAE
jgi:uncharacterized membrane protein YhaH (DUF805 family)